MIMFYESSVLPCIVCEVFFIVVVILGEGSNTPNQITVIQILAAIM